MWRDGVLDHVTTELYISAVVASGQTTAQGFLGPVPAGYVWYIERMSAYSTTAQTAAKLEISVQTTNIIQNNWDRASREDYTNTPANDIADENNAIWIPEGNFLVAYWTGLVATDFVCLGTQIAVHLVLLNQTPRQLMTQVHETHVPPHTIIAEHVPALDGTAAPPRPPAMPGAPDEPPPVAPSGDPTPDERQIAATADALRTL